jgi:solute carrier family 25 carnitine/acylcarnitine transporter 20/29
MSEKEEHKEWLLEGILSLVTGSVYGATSIIVGHPFDTIKTKLQAQSEFMLQENNLFSTIREVWKKEGIIGFYRGAIPPLVGSVMFRSLQFYYYQKFFFYWKDNENMTREIPGTLGMQPRVIVAGILASSIRSVLECPFEYAKVKRQTGQKWDLRSAFHGFPTLYFRTVGLLTSFFMIVDTFNRKTNLKNYRVGEFLTSGIAGSLAWTLIWPLENMKNIIQAETKNVGNTWIEKFNWIIKTHGFHGLYRGIIPGVAGVFFRNGSSMVAMQYASRKLSGLSSQK